MNEIGLNCFQFSKFIVLAAQVMYRKRKLPYEEQAAFEELNSANGTIEQDEYTGGATLTRRQQRGVLVFGGLLVGAPQRMGFSLAGDDGGPQLLVGGSHCKRLARGATTRA